MTTLSSTIGAGFADYLQEIRTRIFDLLQPLSNEQIWQRPHAYGNSVGNLLLHLTGNLNYYIGAQIATTGYVRNRDREFSDSGKSKQQLLKDFSSTIDKVQETLRKQSDQDWLSAYSAVGSEANNRFEIILHCAAHADHHVGQIIYLQKELTGTKLKEPASSR